MKIVFFDIDGVLNHVGTRGSIDEDCMAELKRIIRETGAFSVISSSWKEAFTKYDMYSDRDRDMLLSIKNDPELNCLGWTPDIDEENRENEVEDWLLDYDEDEIESFVIIDDLDFNFLEKFPGNFVKTAGYWGQGLTKTHADRCIEILNRPKETK